MNKKKSKKRSAKSLSPVKIKRQLKRIGVAISAFMEECSTPSELAYEIEMSISQLYKYCKGRDMYLSTFLRILHGLNINGTIFFNRIEKQEA